MRTSLSRLISWGLLLALFFIPAACTPTEPQAPPVPLAPPQAPGLLTLGLPAYQDVDITTKSTLPEEADKRVQNFAVVIFNANGKRVWDHYYSAQARKETLAQVQASEDPAWWGENVNQHGTVQARMAAPDVVEGHLYVVANLSDDLLNLSTSFLSNIHDEEDFRNMVVTYHMPTTSRVGVFNMVGYAPVTVQNQVITFLEPGEGDSTTYGHCERPAANPPAAEDWALQLRRFEVKVHVNVGVVPEHQITENGVTTTLKSFTPISWQVKQLPLKTWVFPHGAGVAPPAPEYFDSEVHAFETTTDGFYGSSPRQEYGFSFYSLENPVTAKQSVGGNYHLRDRRTKAADGSYADALEGDCWAYAPEGGTYVVIKGYVELEKQEGAGSPRHSLATATYYVHLGDFGHSEGSPAKFDNYALERNTHYTYTINLKGVSAIEAEVDLDKAGWSVANERQSGATAHIASTLEGILDLDAHFEQRVLRFNYQNIHSVLADPSQLTFYVSTPFGRTGVPDRVGVDQVEVPNGLDYKWVNFLLHSKEASYVEPHGAPDGGERVVDNPAGAGYYCPLNRYWPQGGKSNPQLMNILELCKYLREQALRKSQGLDHDFDLNNDILVTAFVDEFYYEADPVTLQHSPSFWQRFVNKPERVMHILCGSDFSSDGESSVTNAVVTLRQKSIQCVFNQETCVEAWGCETVDEHAYDLFFFHNAEGRATNQRTTGDIARNERNGLYNSVQLWGLLDAHNQFQRLPWGRFLDWARPDDYRLSGRRIGFMQTAEDSLATLRYACLQRNRDENGNGVIDPEEVKWYMAAFNQLRVYFVGELGVNKPSRLYNIEHPVNAQSGLPGNNYWLWRAHVVSSTIGYDNNKKFYKPKMVWAEEGFSIGFYGEDNQYSKPGGYTLRCVRDLPMDVEFPFDPTNPDSCPAPPIAYENLGDGNWRIDLSTQNAESRRIHTSTELLCMDQNDPTARPSAGFETYGAALGNHGEWVLNADYPQLQAELLLGKSRCPEGWRLPNLRELVVCQAVIPSNDPFWGGKKLMVCNYYSFGALAPPAQQFDLTAAGGATNYTWYVSQDRTSIENVINPNGDPKIYGGYIRCVRDIR